MVLLKVYRGRVSQFLKRSQPQNVRQRLCRVDLFERFLEMVETKGIKEVK